MNGMSWSFCPDWRSRTDVVKHVTSALFWGSSYQLLNACPKGNSVWMVLKHLDTGEPFIAYFIIKGGTKDYPGWGHKSLSHRDGIDCPVTYLNKLHPAATPEEEAWRDAVRRHAKQAATLAKRRKESKPGDEVTYGGRTYRLVKSFGRKGWLVEDSGGSQFRMKARQLSVAVAAA